MVHLLNRPRPHMLLPPHLPPLQLPPPLNPPPLLPHPLALAPLAVFRRRRHALRLTLRKLMLPLLLQCHLSRLFLPPPTGPLCLLPSLRPTICLPSFRGWTSTLLCRRLVRAAWVVWQAWRRLSPAPRLTLPLGSPPPLPPEQGLCPCGLPSPMHRRRCRMPARICVLRSLPPAHIALHQPVRPRRPQPRLDLQPQLQSLRLPPLQAPPSVPPLLRWTRMCCAPPCTPACPTG